MKNIRGSLAAIIIATFIVLSCDSTKQQNQESLMDFAPTWNTDLHTTRAFDGYESIWREFRQRHPYHIQTIGVEHFDQDNSYVFILSEPPSSISSEDITKLFGRYNSELIIKENKVGYDGWTKDAVLVVADIPTSVVEEIVRKTNLLFYDTDYKSEYYLNLSSTVGYVPFNIEKLNYEINSKELYNWFLISDEAFVDSKGKVSKLNSILNSEEGVFESLTPGFLALVLDKNKDLTRYKTLLRQFTLDSDIILGAISYSDRVALIARERELDLHAFPPLRTETIIQLAAANKDELAQSYERNMFLAGKLNSGKDWAPIYLSNELLNTEYGSILNLTDQMLKSWSLNGNISYVNWPHPKPKNWAFIGEGVMDELDVSTLTFNWNTSGAVYSYPYEDFEVVAFNRTGSLPISYFPEGLGEAEMDSLSVAHAEEAGYDFFSSLNNPDLVRVSQYAAIYQIFSQFNVSSDTELKNGRKPSKSGLEEHYVNLYKGIRELSDFDLQQIALVRKTEILDYLEEIESYLESDYLSRYEKDSIQTYFNNWAGNEYDKTFESVNSLKRTFLMIQGQLSLEDIAAFNANPRQFYGTEDVIDLGYSVYETLNSFSTEPMIDYLRIDRKAVMTDYVGSYANSESNWIKTPSIVLSWSEVDSATSVGGHNLGSRMVDFKLDKTLAKGQYRIVEIGGRRIVYTRNADLNPGVLKTLSKTKKTGIVNINLDNGPIRVRDRSSIVSVKSRERGLNANHATISKQEGGLAIDGQIVKTADEVTDLIQKKMANTKGKEVILRYEKLSEGEVRASVLSSDLNFNMTPGRINYPKGSYSLDFSKATIIKAPNNSFILVTIPKESGFGSFKIKVSRINAKVITVIERILQKLLSRFGSENNVRFDEASFKNDFKTELRTAGIDPGDVFIQEEVLDVFMSWLKELDLKSAEIDT